MKKTLLALFAGLFVACGTLSAAYVTADEMVRIKKAANAYSATSQKFAADAQKVSDLNEHIALTKDFISFLETDVAINETPADFKKYFDTIRVRMGQVLKFVQDAPNWQGTEEEWQKRFNQMLNSVEVQEKEMVEYLKSCEVRKTRWRMPFFVYWIIGGVVISAITGVYNMLKKK